jgi:hypothetical protein
MSEKTKLMILVKEVSVMRAYQKAYFKTKKKDILLQAKEKETKVDNLLQIIERLDLERVIRWTNESEINNNEH